MLINSLVLFIAVEHVWFMIFEIFMWNSAYARRAFKMSKETAASSAALAKNQGLYNGFLAAGLIWSILIADSSQAHSVKIFFLCCVGIAGIFGALTANYRIFFIQALPAFIALGLLV